jgi:hypothetical protein
LSRCWVQNVTHLGKSIITPNRLRLTPASEPRMRLRTDFVLRANHVMSILTGGLGFERSVIQREAERHFASRRADGESTSSYFLTSNSCIYAGPTAPGGLGRRYMPLLTLCSCFLGKHPPKWCQDYDRWRFDLSWSRRRLYVPLQTRIFCSTLIRNLQIHGDIDYGNGCTQTTSILILSVLGRAPSSLQSPHHLSLLYFRVKYNLRLQIT